MFHARRAMVAFLVLAFAMVAPMVRAQDAKQSEQQAMYYRYLKFASLVRGGSIQPHWMADGSGFWYAEGAPANTVIYKVDAKANTKTPLFDTARLRQAVSAVLGQEPPYQAVPFEDFTFIDGEKAIKFTVEHKDFILQLDTYAITQTPSRSEAEKSRLVPQVIGKSRAGGEPIDVIEVCSPDRRWFAGTKEYNLYLRSADEGRRMQITDDGIKDHEWDVEGAKWSPDSRKLAIKKVDSRRVLAIPIVHWLKPTEEVEWVHFTRAGAPMRQTELFVVDILSKRQVRVDLGEQPDQYIFIIGWRPEGSELLFLRTNRALKKLDLLAANPTTGSARVVLTETQKTFIGGLEFLRGGWSRVFTPLGPGKRFIWMSEGDGWNHLYLYDTAGTLIRRLTEGAFPVLQVVAVDERTGWVYFTAHAEKRVYDTHLYRVNLEGRGFMRLTEAAGQHTIQFTPSKEFFLDTHSSTDRPPEVEWRRADGKLLRTLSKANVDALTELKWSPPEEFVVKAADSKTDLYGVLYKPYDFDPNKKYPVIEHIYASPNRAVVSRSFVPAGIGLHAQALAQLGFITFMVDGRGTPERGKAFQDVVYGNYGRNEIPDHAATVKQLAEKRPYMDLRRVGIYGGSAGGYFTLRALLLAPDVYHVGIAMSTVPDAYRQAILIEPILGLPQNNKEWYEYASNLRLVANLKGKLLLIGNTSYSTASFAPTMRMVDALIQAGKPFDLLVLPEQEHSPSGASRTYWLEAIRRYFQEHLKP